MTAKVTVRVDREGMDPEDVVLVLDLDHLTMREAVRLEETVGPETFAALISGGLQGPEGMSPKIVRGLIFAKLKTLHPDVELDAFDVDLEELGAALSAEVEVPLAEPSGDG